MRMLVCLAWSLAALASPALAGGEKAMQQLLAEGFEFKVAVERFVIVQRTAPLLGDGGAFLCPIDPSRLLQSLREVVCEPLVRPN